MTDNAGLIEKLRSVHISRRGLGAGVAAMLAALHGREAQAQDSTPVVFADETFDADGATLRIAGWGGFWLEIERKLLLDQFQEDFKCTVQYTSAPPWFPQFVAGGVDNPPFDVTNWNQPELFRAAKAGATQGGFFVPIAEVRANVPNSVDLWDLAYEAGHEAMRNAMPLKIGDFTSHMQTLLERGEVDICVEHDGEVFSQMDQGVPVDFLYWQERKPILPQIMTVSQGSSDVQKRLAYAYINRACSPEIQEQYAAELYLHPTNKHAVIPEN